MKARIPMVVLLLSSGLVPCLLSCGWQSRAGTGDLPTPTEEKKPPLVSSGGKHALLVGCTLYPNLRKSNQLEGPANDVLLLRKVLMDEFSFPDKSIVILSEKSGKDRGEAYRPTRKNIEREFKRLTEQAKPGDQVVILLSGHGGQQPEPDPPPDPQYAEPDGLDEVFLAADAGPWDKKKNGTVNAIVDDEFRVWTQAILDKGTFLWFIADCCHSGSLLRGSEVERKVTMEDLGIPPGEIKAAVARAANREKNRDGQDTPFHLGKIPGKLAAIYAARSSEPTVELPLPQHSPDAKPYGLLTWNLCQVLLRKKSSLTYRELVQRTQENYQREGRDFPIPLVEGNGRDFKVLGKEEWPGRSRFFLSKDEDNDWQINGGALHGFTKNSILAVYPPSGQAGADKLAGHVCITAAGPFTATVSPCAFGKLPRSEQLPERGRCELVFVDFGDLRLQVAVDRIGQRGQTLPAEETKAPASLLHELASEKGSMIQLVADPTRADWLVRPGKEGLYLLPARGILRTTAKQDLLLGPFPADAKDPKAASKLKETLLHIARVQNLRRLAAPAEGDPTTRGERLKVKVEVLKFASKNDLQGKVVPFAPTLSFRDGDIIAFRVKNVSEGKNLYVSVLYLGAGYEIAPLYPEPEDVQDPLVPGYPVQTRRVKVRLPWGLESLLVIAVPARGQPLDFSGLAQPSLARARSGERGQRALDTPLGRLLQNACFGEGARGLQLLDVDDHLLELRSWQALPRE